MVQREDWFELRDWHTDQISDRHLPVGAWQLPESVRLEDGELVGDFLAPIGTERVARETPGLWQSFSRLHRRTDVEIAAFAERFGLLGLCRHGAPFGHDFRPHFGGCGPAERESLDAWRSFSRAAQAALDIGNELRASRPGRAQDWRDVFSVLLTFDRADAEAKGQAQMGLLGLFDEPARERLRLEREAAWDAVRSVDFGKHAELSIDVQRSNLAWFLTEWLRVGSVHPMIEWRKGMKAPRIQFGRGSSIAFGVFGAIGIQLVAAVSSAQAVETCSSCGELITGRRRPEGKRRYCSKDECRRARLRDAQRDRRAGLSNGHVPQVKRPRR